MSTNLHHRRSLLVCLSVVRVFKSKVCWGNGFLEDGLGGEV